MELTIGKEYSCLDTCGMMFAMRIYRGMGSPYNTLDGKVYYAELNKTYYVFESVVESNYKWAVCDPIYSKLKWNGTFQVIRYGQDLNHIFVNFRQKYFALGDKSSVRPTDFPKRYSKDISNSGPNGYFIE